LATEVGHFRIDRMIEIRFKDGVRADDGRDARDSRRARFQARVIVGWDRPSSSA
jgi:hypothetical protein